MAGRCGWPRSPRSAGSARSPSTRPTPRSSSARRVVVKWLRSVADQPASGPRGAGPAQRRRLRPDPHDVRRADLDQPERSHPPGRLRHRLPDRRRGRLDLVRATWSGPASAATTTRPLGRRPRPSGWGAHGRAARRAGHADPRLPAAGPAGRRHAARSAGTTARSRCWSGRCGVTDPDVPGAVVGRARGGDRALLRRRPRRRPSPGRDPGPAHPRRPARRSGAALERGPGGRRLRRQPGGRTRRRAACTRPPATSPR